MEDMAIMHRYRMEVSRRQLYFKRHLKPVLLTVVVRTAVRAG